jgi:adenylate cyclase
LLSNQPMETRELATCAAVYIGEDGRMLVANVGDVGVLLVRSNGSYLLLSHLHTTADVGEQGRLKKSGAHLSASLLLEGETPLTRAFGAFHLVPSLAVTPHLSELEVGPEDMALVVATCNVWNFLGCDVVSDLVLRESTDMYVAAQKIRDMTIAYSPEGIYVAIMDLRGRTEEGQHILPLDGKRKREDVMDSTLSRLPKEIEAPEGRLALIFTDIRESTVLWESHTTAMRAAQKMHHMIMRRLLRTIGGYEVKTEGDAFMVAFSSVSLALKWCMAVQVELLSADWPSEILQSPLCAPVCGGDGVVVLYRGLSVRMGIHYGEMEGEVDAVTGRTDYNGVPVIIASRISSKALGGQLLASEVTYRQYLAEGAEEGIQFIDIGDFKLKGIEASEHLYAVYPASLIGRHEQPLQ